MTITHKPQPQQQQQQQAAAAALHTAPKGGWKGFLTKDKAKEQ